MEVFVRREYKCLYLITTNDSPKFTTMKLVRQSMRTQPPFGVLGDPPMPTNAHVLYEERFYPAQASARAKDERRLIKVSSKKELRQAGRIERLIVGNDLSFSLLFCFVRFCAYPEHKVISL